MPQLNRRPYSLPEYRQYSKNKNKGIVGAHRRVPAMLYHRKEREKMYFDELLEKIETLAIEREKKRQDHNNRLEAIDQKGKELMFGQEEALKNGNSDAYIKFGGMIAVNDAKRKAVESEEYDISDELKLECIEQLENECKNKFDECACEILKLTDKLLENAQKMEDVQLEYKTAISTVQQALETEKIDYVYNYEIGNMINYYKKVICPECTERSAKFYCNSIRGYAFLFKKPQKESQNENE